MSILTKPFGKYFGKDATLLTLVNKNGFTICLTNAGGALVSVFAKDKAGDIADVVLGFDDASAYETSPSVGVLIGRFGNRIEKGAFELNGKTYNLFINNGPNHLHGGKVGFSKKLWDYEILDQDAPAVAFSLFSPDGDEGYPGNLSVKVVYTLTDDNGVLIEYSATTDADTVINLTNHSYFNLAGHQSESLQNHELFIDADKFLQADANCLADGNILDVANTPFDFTKPKQILQDIDANYDQLKNGNGYDHCFCIKGFDATKPNCFVKDIKSGRTLAVYTDQVGVQLYTANSLDGRCVGKNNVAYQKRCAFCLETQGYPNSPTHKHFPSPVLQAGKTYTHKCLYQFNCQ